MKNLSSKIEARKSRVQKIEIRKIRVAKVETRKSRIPKIETRKFEFQILKHEKFGFKKVETLKLQNFPIQFTTSVCRPLFYRNRKDHRTHLAKVNRTSPWLMINFWSNSSVIRSFLNQTTFVRRLSCNLQDSIVLPTMTKTVS